MRPIERQKEILRLLKELWTKFPDQRLGQLLENYVFYQGKRGDMTSIRLFHQEDDETLTILKAQVKSPHAPAAIN
jgi:hypothetical protein